MSLTSLCVYGSFFRCLRINKSFHFALSLLCDVKDSFLFSFLSLLSFCFFFYFKCLFVCWKSFTNVPNDSSFIHNHNHILNPLTSLNLFVFFFGKYTNIGSTGIEKCNSSIAPCFLHLFSFFIFSIFFCSIHFIFQHSRHTFLTYGK